MRSLIVIALQELDRSGRCHSRDQRRLRRCEVVVRAEIGIASIDDDKEVEKHTNFRYLVQFKL